MDFVKALDGYSLVTAEILYRMPDYQTLIQEFIWQEYDMVPDLPRLQEFLIFWEENLDGPLYRITVAHQLLLHPHEIRIVQ